MRIVAAEVLEGLQEKKKSSVEMRFVLGGDVRSAKHVSSSDEEGNLDYRERGWDDDNENKCISTDF